MQKPELHQNSIALRNYVARRYAIFPDINILQCIDFFNNHLNFVIKFPASTLSIMRLLKYVHFYWYDDFFCYQHLYVVLTETNTDTIWYHVTGKSFTKVQWLLLAIPVAAFQKCIEAWQNSTHININKCSCGWSQSLQEGVLTQGKKE